MKLDGFDAVSRASMSTVLICVGDSCTTLCVWSLYSEMIGGCRGSLQLVNEHATHHISRE